MNQYIIEPDGFKEVQSRISEAIEKFNKKWQKKYDSYFL